MGCDIHAMVEARYNYIFGFCHSGRWKLRPRPEPLTVEEVMEQAKELVVETGAWKFED